MNLEDIEKLLGIIDDSHFTSIDLQVGDVHLSARKGGAAGLQSSAGATGDGVRQGGPLAAATTNAAAPPSFPASPPPATSLPGTAADTDGSALDGRDAWNTQDGVLVRAPVVGVFYRAPSPGAEPFASEGQVLTPEDTIGSIEVMKLFSSVAAGTAGTLVRFLAENTELVEYDQPLALIRPAAS